LSIGFACKFFFKAYRIVEGDLDSSLILVTVPPIFGPDVGFLGGKPFSKRLNRSIASSNFLSTSGVLFPASAADFNASSAAINTFLNRIEE
jgi:hypothetical protein